MENKRKKKIQIKNGSERIIQYYCVLVDSLARLFHEKNVKEKVL
jgi:hypothetical protein